MEARPGTRLQWIRSSRLFGSYQIVRATLEPRAPQAALWLGLGEGINVAVPSSRIGEGLVPRRRGAPGDIPVERI